MDHNDLTLYNNPTFITKIIAESISLKFPQRLISELRLNGDNLIAEINDQMITAFIKNLEKEFTDQLLSNRNVLNSDKRLIRPGDSYHVSAIKN